MSSDPRRRDLAKIHIAKKWAEKHVLGFDDEVYRGVLWDRYGVESSAVLASSDRAELIEYFKKLGWREAAPKKAPKVPANSNDMARKIRALWLTLRDMGVLKNASEPALRRFVKRQTGIEVPEWLDGHKAAKVIEALKSWIAREAKKATHG